MTDQPDLRAAVAAGVVGSEESYRALLSAIVEVARSIFGAKASSILLLDEETEELVFEAVVGEGEDTLLGTRFPAGNGNRGLGARDAHAARHRGRPQRSAVRDATSPRARATSRRGSWRLRSCTRRGRSACSSVLDRPEQTLFSLQEMELLGLFANQAAIAVDLLLKARRAEALLGDGGGDLAVVARLATAVDALEDEQREAGLRLLDHLARTLGARSGDRPRAKKGPGGCTSRPGLGTSYARALLDGAPSTSPSSVPSTVPIGPCASTCWSP